MKSVWSSHWVFFHLEVEIWLLQSLLHSQRLKFIILLKFKNESALLVFHCQMTNVSLSIFHISRPCSISWSSAWHVLEVFLGYLIWPERTHPSCRHLVLCTEKSPTITCILSYSHESLAVLHCRAYIWETKICVSERQSALNILGEVKK